MSCKSTLNVWHALLIILVVGGALPLIASSPARAAVSNPPTDQELTKQECGACHYAYPREYLPAYSWKKIIDHLDNHFGEDASLDKESRTHILAYMAGGRSMDIPVRITELPWWKQAHGPGFKALAAKNNIHVSNCGKCHR